jgi:hypothetical protein
MFRNLGRTLAAILLLGAILIGGLVAASAGEGQGSGANFCGGEATSGTTGQEPCVVGTTTTVAVTTTTVEVTTTTHPEECEPYICEFQDAE